MKKVAWGRLRAKPLRDWTLRARVVSGVLALLVVLCSAIGLFTEVALQHYLMGRLDGQLNAAGGRVNGAFGGTSPPGFAGSLPPDFSRQVRNGSLLPPGSEINTIGVRVLADGTVDAAQILQQTGQAAKRTTLPSGTADVLARVKPDGKPHDVDVPGYGSYRVVAARNTNTGDILITGLPLSNVRATLVNLTAVITIVTVVGLIIAAVLGAFIVRLALRPLRRVTSIASKVAEMPLDEGEVALAVRVPNPNPHTEVGQVGVALNRMLENVSDALNARHQSETRVRQFVADASHELRTPLASIRGYAELTRRSREVAPADIAHAMTRVESEANRMTTLVEDLLLLARLDAGRPLAAVEVDLTRLIVDVVSDAHAAGPAHKWHLDVGNEPVIVRGDEPRLQQVLVNILANARTHTPVDTNVWVSLTQQGKSAVVEVRDDGPGIPPGLMPDIFERFSRGEGSRSRAAGSTGLGLAIVAAVVAAHGGDIGVRSAPGETAFTLRLPMHGATTTPSQTATSLTGQVLQV
jgi:two-component system OmpR family sensor kinase